VTDKSPQEERHTDHFPGFVEKNKMQAFALIIIYIDI
jgi:hypothetical protein